MTKHQIETKRQELQANLDREKTKEQRNKMGQFSTPITLATDILQHAKNLLPKRKKVRFLDPAVGTGSFYSAFDSLFPSSRVEKATGYEIDEHYGIPSKQLWSEKGLDYRLADFTRETPPEEGEKYNLVICNPPYVRHHHLNDQKEMLREKSLKAAQMKLSGLSGLYCYFMALSHPWMEKDAIAGWLIPSEFMTVNYGRAIQNYLLNEVTLLQIHRFDPEDVQFDDALVSSAIVWFQNKVPSSTHQVKFSYGGKIENPSFEKNISIDDLRKERKWTRFPRDDAREIDDSLRLKDFFSIRRGIATGDNKFFVLTREQIKERGLPIEQFRPILPSPRSLRLSEIEADNDGFPAIDNQLFVLDCKLPLEEIKRSYPDLYAYLEEGVESGVSERYLCKARKIWYSQEQRPTSQFYCTYIGRSGTEDKKPFRFILNHSKAIVANSYLILYPKPQLAKLLEDDKELNHKLISALNSITGKAMLDEGRVYGGGLHKMEPKELGNVHAREIQELLKGEAAPIQADFFAA